ncbi:MAG: hypothetical protein AAF682_18560 [Planctomycetota bacterium]
MSWDIFVQDLPPNARSTSDIPDDFEPRAIGARAAIIESIRAAIPGADFSDPEWGKIDGPGYSIEVNLGPDGPSEGFALHVRGGDAATFVVHEILATLGLRALDGSSETGFFSLAEGSLEGLARWREYRDRALRGGGA